MRTREDEVYRLSRLVLAPCLTEYVRWVLEEAERRGITTLFFLARDGYVLMKIAQRLQRGRSHGINLRYLYCSRASLRMPSYHLIGEEAYSLLFLGGYHVTLRTLLERGGIPERIVPSVLKEAGYFRPVDLDRELSRPELAEAAARLRSSGVYCDTVMENSRKQYGPAMAYLRQEGLTGEGHIGIVDSGWTGSMQRSLGMLLRSDGWNGQITGFYFGMYASPRESSDGEYLTWYFSHNTNVRNKILFCNNLFECMLSAPHGMTTGYELKDGTATPVLLPGPGEEQLQLIRRQLQGVEDGVEDTLRQPVSHRECVRRLQKLMARPSRTQADAYGAFAFSDEVTDAGRQPLADAGQTAALEEYAFSKRLLRRMRGKKMPAELFWPYGTLAFIDDSRKRRRLRYSIYFWEWLRYSLPGRGQ